MSSQLSVPCERMASWRERPVNETFTGQGEVDNEITMSDILQDDHFPIKSPRLSYSTHQDFGIMPTGTYAS